MGKDCAKCGKQADEGEKFKRMRWKGKWRYYCAACWQKKIQVTGRVLLTFFSTCALVAVIQIWPDTSGWILLNCAVAAIVSYFVVAVHEFGHAVAALCCGTRVFKIAIGKGKSLLSFRLGRWRIQLNMSPGDGETSVGWCTTRWFRTRAFLIILAGPTVNLALLAVMFSVASPGEMLDDPIPGTRLVPMFDLFLVNLLALTLTMVPFRLGSTKAGTQPVQSDGYSLLTIPFTSPSVALEAHATYFATEGQECCDKHDYEGAARWFGQGLSHYPEDFTNRYGLGFARLFLNQCEGCREDWQFLLARKDLDAGHRAVLLNNIAWVDLMIGSPELLQEADSYSQEAMDLQGWSPPIQGTRGSVLIELGHSAKGIPLVRRAFKCNEDPRLKALNACYLAIGELRLGNLQAALVHRDQARSLQPDCQLLARADREIAEYQPPKEPQAVTAQLLQVESEG